MASRSRGNSLSSKAKERVGMRGMIHNALKTLEKIADPRYVKVDQALPQDILANAKGVAFLTTIKAGFLWSGAVGTGIVMAKLGPGRWSGPSAIGSAGMGFGLQVGASKVDSVLVLNNDAARQDFAEHFRTFRVWAQTLTGPSTPQIGSQRL